MINIIPRPNTLIDKKRSICINGFNINCPDNLKKGLDLFKCEYKDYLNGNYDLIVLYKNFSNEEAYSLKVTNKAVIIEAKTEKGLFYATRSLKQLMYFKNGKLRIKSCVISDKPKMKYRSFSLDEVRHFFGKEEVKKIIDILALLKFNYFHWHLSDDQGFRVNFKKYPKLKEIGSKRLRTQIKNDFGDEYEDKVYEFCYEEEEISEIINYAKQRYISVIPEFDMPGHTASIVAAYPYLHCNDKQIKVFERACGNVDILCPSKERTYEFIEDLYAEILRLFNDSEYVHLGGDEVNPKTWESCPHCKKKMEELNLTNASDLQGYFSNRLIASLKKYNKKLIMWHDGIKEDTNENVILQYWVWQMDQNGISKINNGRSTIYSPCSQCYFDSAYAELPLNRVYNRGIVLKNLTTKGRGNIFGMECCSWNEFIDNKEFLEFMLFPRVHAFIESAWTFKKNWDYDNFKRRLNYHNKILDDIGVKYCKKHLYDNERNEEIISPIFRKENRYIEFNNN